MLTRLLVAINVVVFLWEEVSGATSSGDAMVAHGALLGSAVEAGQWWRIFTSAFLHENVTHIAFNMIALWQVGSYVELIYGARKMLALYVVSAVGSGLLITYWQPDEVTLGASGAIFGLFGALTVAGWQLGAPGRALVRQSVGIIVINLVIGFVLPNISNAGHIGGLVAGVVAGFALFRRPRALATRAAGTAPVDLRHEPGMVTIEHLPVAPTVRGDDVGDRPPPT